MILQNGKAVLELSARSDEFPRMIDWLEMILEEIAFPVKAGQQVQICADEIAANIAEYAYPAGDGTFSITAEFNAAGNKLELIFTDHGIPFDPLRQEAPDVTVPLNERAPGGLGLLVVRRMMDHVEYRRDGGCNILTLVKHSGNGGQG